MKKLIALIAAIALGLMLLLSTLLADGTEALRAWLNGEEFAWGHRRQVWDSPVPERDSVPSPQQRLRPVDD